MHFLKDATRHLEFILAIELHALLSFTPLVSIEHLGCYFLLASKLCSTFKL